ncbi:hypothetical protein BN1708_019590, partial [Verticillium longisporum]
PTMAQPAGAVNWQHSLVVVPARRVRPALVRASMEKMRVRSLRLPWHSVAAVQRSLAARTSSEAVPPVPPRARTVPSARVTLTASRRAPPRKARRVARGVEGRAASTAASD